jgi:hypothetical protein
MKQTTSRSTLGGSPGVSNLNEQVLLTGSSGWQTPTVKDHTGRGYHNQRDGSRCLSLESYYEVAQIAAVDIEAEIKKFSSEEAA